MQYPIDGFKHSLWFDTAVEPPDTVSLTESVTTDVLVIGAGITGLNAAIELAENGVAVVVVDSGVVGGGASGRNGGQVNLGLNLSPDELVKHYGQKSAEPLIDALCRTPSTVFDRIRTYAMNCDAEQNGWIQGAVTDKRCNALAGLAEEFGRYGLDIEVLGAAEIEKRTGTQQYKGGLFVEQAGAIQPLSYTRELTRVAMDAGAQVFTHSGVQTLKSESAGGWLVSTGVGEIRCNTVLVCTNGYTDKTVSGLSKKVVPARSIQVATEPLSNELQAKILPLRTTLVDKRRMVLYSRYDRDGRLTFGDHGPMRDVFCEDDFKDLKQRALDVFPELESVRWDYHWGGRLGITKDSLPFLFAPTPDLLVGMGYNGRGVGMGSMLGMAMAARVLGKGAEQAFMPVTTPEEYFFHAFHEIGAEVVIRWEMFMDRLEVAQAQKALGGNS